MRQRQLELPVLVQVSGKTTSEPTIDKNTGSISGSDTNFSGFHKPASAGDQSIYKAISDAYFGLTSKEA